MSGDTDLLRLGGRIRGKDHPALHDAARAVDKEIANARGLGFATEGITNGRHIDGAALRHIDGAIVAPDALERAGWVAGAVGDRIGILEGDWDLCRDEPIERLFLGVGAHERECTRSFWYPNVV
jgi:hypothetical protein